MGNDDFISRSNNIPSNAQQNTSNTSTINHNAMSVAILTLISRLLGFVRIGVLSAIFGATGTADILNLVLSIPNNLRKLLAEGALHNAYMPSYANTIAGNPLATPQSKILFTEVLWYFGSVSLLLVMSMSIFSSTFIALLFDFNTPADQLLATQLFSYLIYFLFLISIASIISGLLQSHKRFVIPALSPSIMSISIISAMILLYEKYSVFAVVYGYLVGGLLQILILSIPLISLGYKHLLRDGIWRVLKRVPLSFECKMIFKRFPIASLAVIFPILGQQISFYFASTLAEGSTSAFSYAIVFWQLPVGVVSNAIISVSFAYLLTAVSQNDTQKIGACIENAIEKLATLLLPISILMIFFSYAGIAVALQRGAMNNAAVVLTSQVLRGFVFGLLPMGLYVFMQKIFFSFQKHRWVLVYAMCFTIIDIIISLVLIQTNLQVRGLSYAYTISMCILVPIMYIHIQSFVSIYISIKKYIKIVLGIIPLFLASYILMRYTQHYWVEGSTLLNSIRFIVVSMILFTIIIIGYRLMGIRIIPSFKQKKNAKEQSL